MSSLNYRYDGRDKVKEWSEDPPRGFGAAVGFRTQGDQPGTLSIDNIQLQHAGLYRWVIGAFSKSKLQNIPNLFNPNPRDIESKCIRTAPDSRT